MTKDFLSSLLHKLFSKECNLLQKHVVRAYKYTMVVDKTKSKKFKH
jgi:hypothetical protein